MDYTEGASVCGLCAGAAYFKPSANGRVCLACGAIETTGGTWKLLRLPRQTPEWDRFDHGGGLFTVRLAR